MSKQEEGGVSRRGLLKAGALSGVAAVAGSAAAAAGAAGAGDRRTPDADEIVLINGRIYTMDDKNTVVRSVAIKQGKIVHTGFDSRLHLPRANVIDLGGRTVVPGVIEPHVHIVSLANRPGYHTPLENCDTIAEVQQTLAARRAGGVPEGQWITSMGGWHPNQFTDVRRPPNRAELDAAVSDRPVLIWQQFTGPAWVNSMGKALLESYTGPLAGPPVVGDDGRLASGAAPSPATIALYHLRIRQTFDDKIRSTLDAMAYSAAVGVTANLDQVLFPVQGPPTPTQILSNLDSYRMYDSWLELDRQERTFVRLQTNFLQNQSDPALPELKERLRNQFQFFGDDMMMTGSIGEWAAPLSPRDVWFEAQRLVAQAQWRNENSPQSLAALQQVVEAYEACDAEFGIKHLRWMAHHVPFVSADLLTRLKNLGCGVEMGAFRWVTSAATTPPTTNVGPPFRTIYDHGVQVGIHGDGVHIAPLNPWLHIFYAVTGINSYGVQVNPGQHLTRLEALRTFTRNNAWFLKMEKKIGTLEVGKLADMLVLNRDYFTVPDADIRKIRPVLTIIDGTVVHDTGELGAVALRRRDTSGHDPRGRWDRA
jgi:predicted amidohydrolase YtcJ